MWDDVATLVRAQMNRRIEDYIAVGICPRIMILDGACLCRKMRHPIGDSYDFLSDHNDYKIDRDGRMVSCVAAEMFTEHMLKAARLAALFFCQPSGGPAVAE
eukprot:6965203-Pyramimonas_sp.AAC.1